ncbi:MAG: hypothetical protein IKB64_00900 [Paludibacteraceae bacterium]|nr:hypothetical protein [Paludibacteraceae bacterium]
MAYNEGGGLSASDVALLTGNGNNGGFGGNGDNAWWIILFLIFGWGRNGFGGGYGGGGSGAADNYVLATDFATIERKLDGINNGICDSTFALNNTMTNGFANVQQTLCQGFNGTNTAIYQNGFNTERGLWNVSSQIADCCCQTQRSIDQVNYNTAMNTNAIQQTLCGNTRDIIEASNANFRALHDEIVANRMEDKNAQIQAQQNEINALRLAASQAKQNSYLINELRPCPIPAYITCNPYQSYNYNPCGCGC